MIGDDPQRSAVDWSEQVICKVMQGVDFEHVLGVDIDLETVARVYSECCPRLRVRGDIQTLSYLLSSYGFSLLQGAQADKALPLLLEALGIERRLENRDNLLYLLDGLACHAAMVDRPQWAARLMGAADSLQTETGIRLMHHIERLLAHANHLGLRRIGSSGIRHPSG